MESNINQRFKEFIAYKGLTVSAFERECGLSNGYVKGVKNYLGEDKRRSIILKFPELNMGWLLTGEGPMLRSEGETQTSTGDNSPNLNESPAANVNCGGMSEEFVAGLLEQKDKEIDRLLRIIDNLTSRRD